MIRTAGIDTIILTVSIRADQSSAFTRSQKLKIWKNNAIAQALMLIMERITQLLLSCFVYRIKLTTGSTQATNPNKRLPRLSQPIIPIPPPYFLLYSTTIWPDRTLFEKVIPKCIKNTLGD